MLPTLTFDFLIKFNVGFSADWQRKQNDIQDLKVQVYCRVFKAVSNTSAVLMHHKVGNPTPRHF